MTQKLIVAKFGGTSVADFNAMTRSANVVINNSDTRLVVLSASASITNILISLSEGYKDEIQRSFLIKKISNIQNSIIYQFKKSKNLHQSINKMIRTIDILSKNTSKVNSKELKDKIVCYGELMSSLIFIEILRQKKANVDWFDIRKVMITDSNFGCAQPNIKILSKKVIKYLKPLINQKIIITQGFIGSDNYGRTTTLGRGGSDYTAALLGEALQATRVDIWTDVSGIYTTDPHLVPTAKRIDEITFKEASEMAIFGAKVLHPSTLLPALRSNIPVYVSSSQKPESGGTYICNKTKNLPLFRALVLRKKQILLTLVNLNKYNKSIFLSKIFDILLHYNISVDILISSESSIVLTVNNCSQLNVVSSSLLFKFSSFCKINLEKNLSLITIIGNNLSKSYGTSKIIFGMLEPFNIRMICYGASKNNVCFVVPNIDSENIIRILHSNLFE
ncbi:lysine-sensitive aspartokinase 3 [Candidatus Pantoea edessiphila]|uniref:Aspartokinase n=1 Tax=Candidatus Pantoea edessiphila TaxID=2044610 RepID=A0A2P5SZX4_9GAMM|nr:lysine-sensitive aspartokinase 3 [Candidatus Pantoea edessiphila]PPI87899.1 lysine-sensitive aspartokinase 3 [Candidatus Pantoea edessiphila]